MREDNWRTQAEKRKPLIATDRKSVELKKYPNDLDFTKTIGGTIYEVKSSFKPDAGESLLSIVSRLFCEGKNLLE